MSDPTCTGHGHGKGEHGARSRARAAPVSKRILVGYGFWIFPAERHHHVLGAVCSLRGAVGCNCRRARAVRTCSAFRMRPSRPCCLLLSSFHLRSGLDCGVGAQCASGPTRALLVTGLLGAAFLALELSEFGSHDSATETARNAAPSCRPSSRWWAATACM